MTEVETVERSIKRKRWVRKIFLEEISDLKFRLSLLKRKERLEEKIGESFDVTHSRQLDAIEVLLEGVPMGPY